MQSTLGWQRLPRLVLHISCRQIMCCSVCNSDFGKPCDSGRTSKYSAFLAQLTSIAVDRLLALLLGIRYGQVVIVNRTRRVVLFIWMKRNCGRPTLPLEHDIIPPFKCSIDNIRADYFNVFNVNKYNYGMN